MSYTKRIVLSFGVVFVCIVLTNILGYVQRLVLSRSFTPAEYGLLYGVYGVFGVLYFMQTFGMHESLVQMIPGSRKQKVKSAFVTLVMTQLVITGAVVVIISLLSPWLAAHYFQNASAAPMLIFIGISFMLGSLELAFIGFFQGHGKAAWYGYLLLARVVVLFIATLILIPYGITMVALAYVLMHAVLPLLHLPLLLKLEPGFWRIPASYDARLLKQMFLFSLPLVFAGGIGILFTYMDTLFITFYRTLDEVGLFNVAMPTASLLWVFSNVIYMVMLPISSEMHAKKQTKLLRNGIGQMYLYLSVLLLPFAMLMLIFPDTIIRILFGEQYAAAAPVLQLLVIGGIPYAFASLNMSVITGFGKSKRIVPALIIVIAVNVLGNLFLVSRFGAAGAAWATSIAFFALFAVTTYSLNRIIPMQVPYLRILAAFASAFASAGSCLLLRGIDLPLWPKIFVMVAVALGVFAVLILALRVLRKKELQQLVALVLR